MFHNTTSTDVKQEFKSLGMTAIPQTSYPEEPPKGFDHLFFDEDEEMKVNALFEDNGARDQQPIRIHTQEQAQAQAQGNYTDMDLCFIASYQLQQVAINLLANVQGTILAPLLTTFLTDFKPELFKPELFKPILPHHVLTKPMSETTVSDQDLCWKQPSMRDIHEIIRRSRCMWQASKQLRMKDDTLARLLSGYTYRGKHLSFALLQGIKPHKLQREYPSAYELPMKRKIIRLEKYSLGQIYQSVSDNAHLRSAASSLGVTDNTLKRYLARRMYKNEQLTFTRFKSLSKDQLKLVKLFYSMPKPLLKRFIDNTELCQEQATEISAEASQEPIEESLQQQLQSSDMEDYADEIDTFAKQNEPNTYSSAASFTFFNYQAKEQERFINILDPTNAPSF